MEKPKPAGLFARALRAWHERSTSAHDTPPEDKVGLLRMVIYGIGGFVNNTLAAAIGSMLAVLNLGLGISPTTVGLIGSIPRLTDALTDPLMGYISDHTRTRWGRRRPYIFWGAIASGVIYIALWWLPLGQSDTFYTVWFIAGSILFYLAYTVFATPWVALGYELTPDFHERTRLMGVQNFIGQLAYVVSPWFIWMLSNEDWFVDQVEGARWVAVGIGMTVIALGILPAIFLRERFMDESEPPPDVDTAPKKTLGETVADFGRGLKITLSSKPFLQLGAATFLVFNGFILISSFQLYVLIYYMFDGNKELGSEWAGYSGTVGAVATFVAITIVTWLGTVVGKRRAFFFAIGVSMVGYALKFVCYVPGTPWLTLIPAPFMAFGLAGLFTLMGSMIADVVDLDELSTYERREGMYGSIFWWVVKLGMAAALLGGGILLELTGFKVELGGNQSESTVLWMRIFDAFVPVLTSGLAILTVYYYPITEETAREVRQQLDARKANP